MSSKIVHYFFCGGVAPITPPLPDLCAFMLKPRMVYNLPYICYYYHNIMNEPVLAPSLLSADFSNLSAALAAIHDGGGGAVHIDVMDGQFVPQITYGQPVIQSLRPLSSLPFDVHLMMERPEAMVDSFAAAGADWLTFHLESTVHVNRLIQHIHSLGKKAGVAIVPSTPVSALSEVLADVDVVLVMTVNPGFGGQKLLPSCVRKVSALRAIRTEQGYGYKISVDGGVNAETVGAVVAAGADIIVSGSAFFTGSLRWHDVAAAVRGECAL